MRSGPRIFFVLGNPHVRARGRERGALFVAAQKGRRRRAFRRLAADRARGILISRKPWEQLRLHAATKGMRRQARNLVHVHRGVKEKRRRTSCRRSCRTRGIFGCANVRARQPSRKSLLGRRPQHRRASKDAGRAARRAMRAQRSIRASALAQAFDPHSPACRALRLRFVCAVLTCFPALRGLRRAHKPEKRRNLPHKRAGSRSER